MKAKLKTQMDNAVRHGAAWFTAAGISGGVFCWAIFELVKAAL